MMTYSKYMYDYDNRLENQLRIQSLLTGGFALLLSRGLQRLMGENVLSSHISFLIICPVNEAWKRDADPLANVVALMMSRANNGIIWLELLKKKP